MLVKLVYSYETVPQDGIGTKNDAAIVAIRRMLRDIEMSISTDDCVAMFSEISIKE